MDKILIIIVIYKMAVEEIALLKNIEGIDILIYDNSPEPQKVNSKYKYHHNPLNEGVSAGYNFGIELARKSNKEYILLLDQDTSFSMEHLNEYLKSIEKNGTKYIYAPIVVGHDKIYSPFLEKKNRNRCQTQEDFVYNESYDLREKSLINSGLMIPLNIIDKIGGYNEKIKLDFSDIYFMEKYKAYSENIILINTMLSHSISGDEGKDKQKELHRFQYYCNSIRELVKESLQARRFKRMLFFRMLRLIVKYRTLKPVFLVRKYYWGNKTI